jgi:hypothetical protein
VKDGDGMIVRQSRVIICKTRNREQGSENREQGAGNREQGTGSRDQGTGNPLAEAASVC